MTHVDGLLLHFFFLLDLAEVEAHSEVEVVHDEVATGTKGVVEGFELKGFVVETRVALGYNSLGGHAVVLHRWLALEGLLHLKLFFFFLGHDLHHNKLLVILETIQEGSNIKLLFLPSNGIAV